MILERPCLQGWRPGQAFHDREGFTTFFDIKVFAIMEMAQGSLVGRLPRAGMRQAGTADERIRRNPGEPGWPPERPAGY
jgi:hypothetical protein